MLLGDHNTSMLWLRIPYFKIPDTTTHESRCQNIEIAPHTKSSGPQPWVIYFRAGPAKSIILHCRTEMLTCQQTRNIYNTTRTLNAPNDMRIRVFSIPRIDTFSNCHQNVAIQCCRVTAIPPCRDSRYHASRFQTPWLISQGTELLSLLCARGPWVHNPGIFTSTPGPQNRLSCTVASKCSHVSKL